MYCGLPGPITTALVSYVKILLWAASSDQVSYCSKYCMSEAWYNFLVSTNCTVVYEQCMIQVERGSQHRAIELCATVVLQLCDI